MIEAPIYRRFSIGYKSEFIAKAISNKPPNISNALELNRFKQ